MNFMELFSFCRENNVGVSVRCHEKKSGTEYYLRLRRGDKVADQVFDESAFNLFNDPNEMVHDRIEELLEEME